MIGEKAQSIGVKMGKLTKKSWKYVQQYRQSNSSITVKSCFPLTHSEKLSIIKPLTRNGKTNFLLLQGSITDTKTGKHYVGSASGLEGGIWGRWSEYARTKHGGNKRLVELIAADPDYCYNFQYSILEVFPIKRDRQEILEYEQLYKRKLYSIPFGLNDN